jgi:hypothetical protein
MKVIVMFFLNVLSFHEERKCCEITMASVYAPYNVVQLILVKFCYTYANRNCLSILLFQFPVISANYVLDA